MLELLKEQDKAAISLAPDVYAVIPSTSSLPVAMKTMEQLRALGLSIQMHASASADGSMGSMKSQFKRADSSGASFALVFGADEI